MVCFVFVLQRRGELHLYRIQATHCGTNPELGVGTEVLEKLRMCLFGLGWFGPRHHGVNHTGINNSRRYEYERDNKKGKQGDSAMGDWQ